MKIPLRERANSNMLKPSSLKRIDFCFVCTDLGQKEVSFTTEYNWSLSHNFFDFSIKSWFQRTITYLQSVSTALLIP